MKTAKKSDKGKVIEILSSSFNDNQSVNFIVKSGKNKAKRVDALMSYSFDVCLSYGQVYLSDDEEACALLMYPHTKKTSLKSIFFDMKLIVQCIGVTRILIPLKREAEIKKRQPKKPMCYLWYIGVLPTRQNCGCGSKLMEDLIKACEEKKLPIYLETSTLRNIPWYINFGFSIYEELELTYKLYFLKMDN